MMAVLILAVVALAGAACRSWGRGKDFEPLSAEDFDAVYLKNALGMIIHEVLSEDNPEALRRLFPPEARSQVDCQAFYQQMMGAPSGVYQPRFWDMKLLEVDFEDGGQRAQTKLTVECMDARPGSGGAGRFIPLELRWVKQGGKWYLQPPTVTVKSEGGVENP